MTEPRLEENASAFERELLQAGTGYRVSAEAREKTLAALGLGATAGAVGAAAAHATLFGKLSAAKGWLGLGWVKSTLAAVTTLGALASAPVVYRALTDEGAPQGAAASAPAAPNAPAKPHGPPASPEPAAGLGQDVSEPDAVDPGAFGPDAAEGSAEPDVALEPRTGARDVGSSKSARSAGKAEPPEVTTEVLRAELAALDAARAKLAGGSPKGALAALDEYARSYPRGLLRLEAEVLRIDALAQAGQTEAAKARATAFLRRHPKGVLAARVRRYAEP